MHDQLIEIISRSPQDRVAPSGPDSLLLGEYEQVGKKTGREEVWRGQLRRIRPNDCVAEGNVQGVYQDAPFTVGVATESGHFLVLPAYRVILYAGSPYECGWTQLKHYLEYHADESLSHLNMLPIVHPDVSSRLKRMQYPKKVVLKAHCPGAYKSSDMPLIGGVMKDSKNYAAEWVRIEIGTGRGQCLKSTIKNTLKKLFRGEHDNVDIQKLTIEGYTSDEPGREKVAIDFIEDRLRYRTNINMTTINTVEDWKRAAYNTLEAALNQKRQHIRDSCQVINY